MADDYWSHLVAILVMEKVTLISSDDLKDKQILNLYHQFDSGQIGRTKKGAVKGFDYGKF